MIRDWSYTHRTVCMYICREKRKPCELANHNGYCQITACIKHSEYMNIENIQPEQWIKSREE